MKLSIAHSEIIALGISTFILFFLNLKLFFILFMLLLYFTFKVDILKKEEIGVFELFITTTIIAFFSTILLTYLIAGFEYISTSQIVFSISIGLFTLGIFSLNDYIGSVVILENGKLETVFKVTFIVLMYVLFVFFGDISTQNLIY